jgi:hypothetical protein
VTNITEGPLSLTLTASIYKEICHVQRQPDPALFRRRDALFA